jgi:N-acetylglucosamine malate deacetylase 1
MSSVTPSSGPMKPMSNLRSEPAPLLAFGAHPDDIEFGCGGVVSVESRAGRPVHLVVCSRGESATHGTPDERTRECQEAAKILGASLELIELEGDAHLEVKAVHAIRLAGIIRRIRPGVVLAPTLVENQHPDHSRLGRLVRDAARLARYGGVAELREMAPHAIQSLFYYALSPGAEPRDLTPIFVDVSSPEIQKTWIAAMEAHATQVNARGYVEMQLTRARLGGIRVGVGHAIALYPNDPPIIDSLSRLCPSASRF